jgi:Na+/H+ antiporter NhaA
MTRVLAPAAPTQSEPRRRVLVAQLAQPVRTFLANEAGSAGLLLAATLVALLWANSPLSDSYVSVWHTELAIRLGDAQIAKDLGHWVVDGLMVLFFFVVGLMAR